MANTRMNSEPFAHGERNTDCSVLFLNEWMERFPWLSAGFTTRRGGVSREPWNTLNCALHVGDAPEDVAANRIRTASAAGFEFDAWTCAEQVHGSDIGIVTKEHRGAGKMSREDAIAAKDGLITKEPGIMLTAFFADCVPLWFVDPDHRAIGIAHAGWRGSVADVAGKTVEAMRSIFGSDPSRMAAAVGPSIGSCCYEVDDYVIDQVKAAGEISGDVFVPASVPGKYMLNLSKYNAKKIAKAGILANRIEITGYCTSCHTDLFFSHRKEGGKTGRMAAWIAIREEVTSG
ncbi:peptidoglycan editing factor PgeF [Paenibacillus alkalitolerans]|uniref:peptidoglycan editing factor PgeF n=1 Tax=Paenibacillus alkalitolerans TaxID=2799335 RepID=UPI001F43A127|nr:peptidoglycan editing factor PgeF [Paenibacillus alkalitolerans]